MNRKSEVITINNMCCPPCRANIERALNQLEGVQKAEVSFTTRKATVEYDADTVTLEDLTQAVNERGYTVVSDNMYSELSFVGIPLFCKNKIITAIREPNYRG